MIPGVALKAVFTPIKSLLVFVMILTLSACFSWGGGDEVDADAEPSSLELLKHCQVLLRQGVDCRINSWVIDLDEHDRV